MSIPFDVVAERYDESRGGEERGVWVSDHVAPLLPAGPLVEIGVGTAIVAKPLQDKGFRVSGVDLSYPMLVGARRRVGPCVAQADALRLPFADASLRSLLSVWVLHLVASVEALLAEVARVLAPGGTYLAVLTVQDDEIPVEHPGDALVHDLRTRLRAGFGRETGFVRLAVPGLAVERLPDLESPPYRVTSRQLAESLLRRENSWVWVLDDETYGREVRPVAEALLAMPDVDEPREQRARQPVVRFTRT